MNNLYLETTPMSTGLGKGISGTQVTSAPPLSPAQESVPAM